MHETLMSLIQLQEIDNQLLAIQEKLGDLPATVQGLKEEISLKKENIKKNMESISKLQSKILISRGKIQDYKAKLEKYQEQLYLVTTNREYDALTTEIDYAKSQISEAEMTILESDEQISALEQKIKIDEADQADLEEQLKEAEKALAATVKSTEAEKERLEDKRSVAMSKVPKRYYQSYERIRKARRGLAVVPMERGACGGCHNRIIPQKRVEIQKGNKIIVCDICGRFLYWKDENGE